MLNYLALCLPLLAPIASRADAAHFTTVFLDDEGVVYVGVKSGDPASSAVVSLPFDSGERTIIALPTEIAGRDVIGLLTEKEKLFVVTTAAEGPSLHVYDRDKGRWSLVGKVACPTFTKVTVKPTSMEFSCEIGKLKKGKTRIARKAISLRKNRIYRRGVWRFPEFLLRYKGRTALLEGPAPAWDRLRLRGGAAERTITADDLLQLPMPNKK